MVNQQGQLKSDLKIRHISMISIAGVIGAGLFIGSGAVINASGPGAILSYAFAGAIVVLVMRMLGEMAAAYPTSGIVCDIRKRSDWTMGRIYDRVVVLVFLGCRHCD